MGDGSCLKFLTEADLYSLLGNALGNAVEACRQVEEEKRQISMIIRSGGDLVSISVTNYYQGQLRFEQDLPVTSRADGEDFHGYGMRSMQAIVRKYGGKLKVKAEDGVFQLTMWMVDTGE
jgi:sensor histidine kinase regulating citrate/malate metabolism